MREQSIPGRRGMAYLARPERNAFQGTNSSVEQEALQPTLKSGGLNPTQAVLMQKIDDVLKVTGDPGKLRRQTYQGDKPVGTGALPPEGTTLAKTGRTWDSHVKQRAGV